MSDKPKIRKNTSRTAKINDEKKNNQSSFELSKIRRNITESRESSLTRNGPKNKELSETSITKNSKKTNNNSRETIRIKKVPTPSISRDTSKGRYNSNVGASSSSINIKNNAVTRNSPKSSLQKNSSRVPTLDDSKQRKQRAILPAKERKLLNKDDSITQKATASKLSSMKTKRIASDSRKMKETPQNDRDRTRTRTLSPHEIKLSKDDLVTASSIDLIKLASLNSAKSPRKSQENILESYKDDHETNEYEDDFEDYESDFEDDFSEENNIEEEFNQLLKNNLEEEEINENITALHEIKTKYEEDRKLDSGSYEMIEKRRLRMAIDRENQTLSQERERLLIRQKSIVLDEGFEENDNYNLLTYKSSNYKSAENQSINFAQAKERVIQQKVRKFAHIRGQELLKNIQLDNMFFTLFEQPPMDYENYMKIFGKLNACQAQTQTFGNDAECQTDNYLTFDKWTQIPVVFKTTLENNSVLDTGKAIYHIGVGGDLSNEDLELADIQIKIDYAKLRKFIKKTEQVILMLLEENSSTSNNLIENSLSFSSGYFLLNSSNLEDGNNEEILNNRSCKMIQFGPSRPNILYSLHSSLSKNDVDWIAQWNLLDSINLKNPKFILSSSGHKITSMCIDPGNNIDVIVAGFSDGSLALWDLNDFNTFENYYSNCTIHLQPASYTTSVFAIEETETKNAIIDIRSLSFELENEPSDSFTVFPRQPAQILTLEENGRIRIWTIVRASNESSKRDFGLAPWGRIRLVHTQDLNVDINSFIKDTSLAFTCFNVDSQDKTHIYLGCVSGHIVHSLRYQNMKINPKLYIPQKDGHGSVTCIETSPFKQPYFLVGASDGIIKLYSRFKSEPIVQFTTINRDISPFPSNISIRTIQWSRSKPLIFFVLDDQSRIHTWNLEVSDLNPINIEKPDIGNNVILDMQLTSDLNNRRKPPLLALAISSGEIHVHKLKKEYIYQSSKEFKKDSSKFLKFIKLF